MRLSWLAGALSIVTATAVALPASGAVSRLPEIRVGTDVIAQKVPAAIVGANHRWPRSGLGMWNASEGVPAPDIVDLSRRSRLKLVRYPGGTVANLFDFRKAIGPQSERGCQVGGGFVGGAEPYDSVYGPDENQRYVTEIGAETEMMVSSVLSAEHAADFVEYMNAPLGTNPRGGKAWAKVRAANGHPAPYGITWWEVGNELYQANQMYWRSPDATTRLRQFAFGGTQRQVDQPLGTECDHRPSAGVSDGSANQEFQVWYPPVVPDSLALRVDGETWRVVEDLGDAGPGDRVYTVDAKSGTVRFGDGKHGQVPAADAKLLVDYDSGPHSGFVDYYREMKRVDPSIKVCSPWEKPEWVELMGREHPYDCLGPHLYTVVDVTVPPSEIHDRMIPRGPQVVGELDALEDSFRATFGDDRIRWPAIQVSEYGTLTGNEPAPEGWPGSVSRMLYDADLVAGMIEHGVSLAVHSNLNHDRVPIGNLFGSAPDFHYTARARELTLYSHLVGSAPVDSSLRANPEATGGGYGALRALATRAADGTVRVVVLNRDRTDDVTARLYVEGLGGRGSVRVHTLEGPDISSYNTPQDEDVVHTTSTTETLTSPELTHTFPAHSMVLLEFGQAASGGNDIGSR